jgi:hypothetical protein
MPIVSTMRRVSNNRPDCFPFETLVLRVKQLAVTRCTSLVFDRRAARRRSMVREMNKPTTYALNVNLSASQVRKRLKGYGFGVRKVEATDRNQAVIVHTATGQHLEDLESLFADVLAGSGEDASRDRTDGESF